MCPKKCDILLHRKISTCAKPDSRPTTFHCWTSLWPHVPSCSFPKVYGSFAVKHSIHARPVRTETLDSSMSLLQAGQACLLGLLILSSLTTGRNQRNHIPGVCDASQPCTKLFPTSLEKKCYRKLEAILASTCFQGQLLWLQLPVKRETGMNRCWKMRIGCAFGQFEHATWTTTNTYASIHATRLTSRWKISSPAAESSFNILQWSFLK